MPARPPMMRLGSFRSVMRPSLTPALQGVVIPLGNRVLVFAQSRGDASERSSPAGSGRVEPVRQGCGITGIEHGGRLPYRFSWVR
ncbi:hypothetical protein ACVW19_000484 [Streptomyces sp. TE5632]